jgi:hypothetical protein
LAWRRTLRAAGLIFACLLLSQSPTLAQFTQQGPKLVGTGAVGNSQQGWSVALSDDGNTAIVGGPGDSSNIGAAWRLRPDAGVDAGEISAQPSIGIGTSRIEPRGSIIPL